MDSVNNYSFDLNKINKNNEIKTSYREDDIDLEDISILYTTEKNEEKRTNFEESFDQTPVEESTQGEKFLEGLKSNKDSLSKELGLNDEQYDSLACIALALASQETGMGLEDGYESENKGIGKFLRGILKKIDVLRGGSSASSGLTQMKIYDFLNGDKLTDEQKKIMRDYGIEADGINSNNLFDNPDKAAIATMVVLSSIVDNYDDYKGVLQDEHKKLKDSFIADSISPEEAKEQGSKLIDTIGDIYKKAPNEQKIKIRSAFKQWLLSKNGSKKGDRGVEDKYNEEIQLNNLNSLLAPYSSDFSLTSNSLDLIRYALTEDGQEMSVAEYCAYGWNKGTGETGMQLDRMLAEKVGTILSNPEDFDYDQFTTNVATLSEKYAQQSNSNITDETFYDLFT